MRIIIKSLDVPQNITKRPVLNFKIFKIWGIGAFLFNDIKDLYVWNNEELC